MSEENHDTENEANEEEANETEIIHYKKRRNWMRLYVGIPLLIISIVGVSIIYFIVLPLKSWLTTGVVWNGITYNTESAYISAFLSNWTPPYMMCIITIIIGGGVGIAFRIFDFFEISILSKAWLIFTTIITITFVILGPLSYWVSEITVPNNIIEFTNWYAALDALAGLSFPGMFLIVVGQYIHIENVFSRMQDLIESVEKQEKTEFSKKVYDLVNDLEDFLESKYSLSIKGSKNQVDSIITSFLKESIDTDELIKINKIISRSEFKTEKIDKFNEFDKESLNWLLSTIEPLIGTLEFTSKFNSREKIVNRIWLYIILPTIVSIILFLIELVISRSIGSLTMV